MNKKVLSAIEPLEHYLVPFRRKQVVLDAHVAKLYGVQTRDVNKAVKKQSKKVSKRLCYSIDRHRVTEFAVENFHRKFIAKTQSALCLYGKRTVYVGHHFKI